MSPSKEVRGKRLLFLGGADIQVPAIERAVERGVYTITCDYLPENPGHQISNEYHNVSTTEIPAVCELAEELGIDGVTSYGSDPSALTASAVSDALGVPGIPVVSVECFSDKIRFRELQRSLAIPHPDFCDAGNSEERDGFRERRRFPAIVKPVDSSGSKGVSKIHTSEEVDKAISFAMSFSRSGRVIMEECLDSTRGVSSGDALVQNGKVAFFCFGDVHFDGLEEDLVPYSITLPSQKAPNFFRRAMDDFDRLLEQAGVETGVFNLDVMSDFSGNPVIIDIGARNGGNMFNDIIEFHTGFPLIDATIDQCLGYPWEGELTGSPSGFFAHFVVRTKKAGVFSKLVLSDEFENCVIRKCLRVAPGGEIEPFASSSGRLGLFLLRFETEEQMHRLIEENEDHVHVVLEEEV